MARIITLVPDGGLNTEAGPAFPAQPGDTGVLAVPYLLEAENIVYNQDGWPQKAPGAAKVNSSATGASDHVQGIFDYWKSGISGSPAQQRMVYSGTALYRESGGTLTSVTTGLEASKVPWFEVINDDLIFATSSTTDVPGVWDQTSYAALGGTPPNFNVVVLHKGRAFAFGAPGAQSRLYYSPLDNHEDWAGAGSGSIDVSPNDGSILTGARSHKGELLLFKGGGGRRSIQRLTGSSPTGSDAFALIPFITGVGGSAQNSIISLRDDLVFWDDLGIHSLVATASFGDYNAAYLSDPISTFFTEGLNHSRFAQVQGVNLENRGYALWTCTRAGASVNDLILLWDYRFTPARFATWPMASVASIAPVKDTNQQPTPWMGTYTGFVLRGLQATRNWMGSAYGYRVKFPYLSFGDAWFDKEALAARIGFNPKGESTFTLAWQRDGYAQQSAEISQGGTGATLAPSSDEFVLDTDVLGGGRYEQAFQDMAGQFKELQIELTQGTVDVDFEPHGLALELEGAGRGATAVPGV